MKKYLVFLMFGLTVMIGGCAPTQQHSSAPDSSSNAAAAQPAAQPTTSQDRQDRIKESDAVRKAMGY